MRTAKAVGAAVLRTAVLRTALLLGLTTPAWAAAAEGLSCDFGEVVLDKIPQGVPYALMARPVRVRNDSARTLDLAFEAVAPGPDELVPGYVPAPDPGWVTLAPARFTRLGPGKTATAIATIRVPGDPALAGKAFQVSLYLHTTAGGPATGAGSAGGGVALALKPRLRFRVAAPGVQVSTAKQPELPARLGPPVLSGTVLVRSIACGTLLAENVGPFPMTFEFEAEGDAALAPAPEAGYAPFPAGITLEIKPKSVVVPGHASALVDVSARLTGAGVPAGKYQGTVRCRVTRGSAATNLMNKVLVVVPAEPSADGGRQKAW